MSDNVLLFVPVDPRWLPTQAAADLALEYVRSISPNNCEIVANFSNETEFYHPYENWDGVRCPACAAELDDWFYDALDKSYTADHFSTLATVTPCCRLETSLNDLNFSWPAAFGRFVIEAWNPGLILDENQKRAVTKCLGCDLHLIWRHI